jgi:hypothetical protein
VRTRLSDHAGGIQYSSIRREHHGTVNSSGREQDWWYSVCPARSLERGKVHPVGGDHQELVAVWKEKWMQAKTNLELAIVHFSEIERVANFPQEHYQRCLKPWQKR